MPRASAAERIITWWEDSGELWYAMTMMVVLLAVVPLGIYGLHRYLAISWPLTAVLLLNSVLAMFLLAHAAPLASTTGIGVAVVLWLYNGALLLSFFAMAAYGGYYLVFR